MGWVQKLTLLYWKAGVKERLGFTLFSCIQISKLYVSKQWSELLCFSRGEWGVSPLHSVNRWLSHPLRMRFYPSGRVLYFHGFHGSSGWRGCKSVSSAFLENVPDCFTIWVSSAPAILHCKRSQGLLGWECKHLQITNGKTWIIAFIMRDTVPFFPHIVSISSLLSTDQNM